MVLSIAAVAVRPRLRARGLIGALAALALAFQAGGAAAEN
jgi:hypothetical protein